MKDIFSAPVIIFILYNKIHEILETLVDSEELLFYPPQTF